MSFLKSIYCGFILLIAFNAPVFALEKVVLQLEWVHQFEFAGFYAAKAQGYYQQMDLEVEIKERSQETKMLQDVLSRKATYGVASAQIILDRINGYPVVLLASYFKQNALALVTHPSIKKPSDLVGKKVMVGDEDLKKTAIGIMLLENNVSFNDFMTIPHKYNAQDFLEGKVDAMSVFVSNELFEIEQSGVAFNVLNPAEYGVYSMDVNVFTSEQEVTEYPERIRRFLKATKKGWQYALAHKEELVDLILAEYSKKKSKEALLYEADKTEALIKPELYEIGSISPEIIAFTNSRFRRVNSLPDKALDKGFIFDANLPENTLQLTNAEQAYLKKKQQLTLCVDPDWMPYEKIEKGQHIGMGADFIQLFSKKINIPVILVVSDTWLQSLELGKQRKCDFFSLVMSTPEREKWLNFSKPFLHFPLVIATGYEQMYVDDLKDVLDKKIGVQKGYAYTELLRLQYPTIDLVEVDSLVAGLNQVRENKILGMVGSLPDMAYAFQTQFIGTLKIAGKLDQSWKLSIGSRNDEPLLQSIFDKAVGQLTENERQDIISRWVSVNYPVRTDYKLLFQILAIVVIIFIFFLYHHIKLKSYSRLLEHQSITDRLTSLNNRMKLDRQLSQSLSLAARYKQPFSVILVDADYFKAINDKYGHLVGDYALKTVAQILKENVRVVDTIGRWGGEEFLIICPSQTDVGAVILANKLCVAINEYQFGYFSTLTCSFGVSSYREHDTEDDIIKRADDALYQAKEHGRNQVCLG